MTTVDFPAGSKYASLMSPAFELARPKVVNADIIPTKTRWVLEKRWNAGRFAERPVEVHLLKDVFVVANGLVFNRELDVYQKSITQHRPAAVEAGRDAIDAAVTAGRLKRKPGLYALCKKSGSGNYGHWLIEMLPMAHILRTSCASLDPRYLVPNVSGLLESVIKTSMDMIGIPENEQEQLANTPEWYEELLVVTGLTEHGHYISPRVFEPIDLIAKRVTAAPRKSLFISRKRVGHRNFANEPEIISTFSNAGYDVIDPGALNFEAQVASFKGAEAIAGVTGAALTSMVFSRPGTRVINFAPASQLGTFFWLLAAQRKLDYVEVRCTQTGPSRGPAPWDTDLSVPQADLAAVIKAAPPP